MNNWLFQLEVEKERRRYEMESAAEERLIRQFSPSLRRRSTSKVIFQWVAALGRLMAYWGCQLESRFSQLALTPVDELPSEQSVKRCSA